MVYQNVLITGVSSGLGFGIAQEMLEQGVHVFGMSRRDLSKLESKLLFQKSDFHYVRADLANFEKIGYYLDQLLHGVLSLDLVVLNAGILGKIQDIRDTSIHELQYLMDVNMYANKILLDELLRRNLSIKQIVAISSGASISGNRGWNGYSLSKAALNMLIQLYANEIPSTHFVALAPGLIDTAMQDYIASLPDSDQFEKINQLKSLKNSMDGPVTAGKKIVGIFPQLVKYVSGSYVDIRKMD